MSEPSPTTPEPAVTDSAESYDRWFREKVATALREVGPLVDHDEAMARMRALIETARNRQKAG